MEAQPQELRPQFRTVGKIGHGCQGEVYEVEDTCSFDRYALKVIPVKTNATCKERERIEQEVKLNMELSQGSEDAYFPKLHRYWFDSQSIKLLFQKCDENAESYLKRTSSSTLRYNFLIALLYDTLRALYSIHSRSIIHRDIKAENILVQRGRFKLADFGLSRIYQGGGHLTKDIGNRLGRSPEFHSGNYCTKTDIWSLGVHVFYLLQGTLPFDRQSLQLIRRNPKDIDKVLCSGALTVDFSPQGRKSKNALSYLHLILADMVVVEPQHRLSSMQLLEKYFGQVSYNQGLLPRFLYASLASFQPWLRQAYLMAVVGWVEFSRMDSKIKKEPHQSNKRKICLKVKVTLYSIFHLFDTLILGFVHSPNTKQTYAQILNNWRQDLSSHLSQQEMARVNPINSLQEAENIFRIGKVLQKFSLIPWVFKLFSACKRMIQGQTTQLITLFDIPIELHKLL